IPSTTKGWTEEEHNGFLHGLEVYGYGNWDAIGVFVPSRSPPQIEAYAQQFVAQGEAVQHPQAATAAQHGSVQDMSSVSHSGGGHGGIESFHEGSADGEAPFAHDRRHLDPVPQSSGLSHYSPFVDNGSVSGSAFPSNGASGELPVPSHGASLEGQDNPWPQQQQEQQQQQQHLHSHRRVWSRPGRSTAGAPPENDEAATLHFDADEYFGLL
ncbi:unnamed protein product, partial [Ectocarpus sp. 12 AP-2014]